jgi:hypothetical protein
MEQELVLGAATVLGAALCWPLFSRPPKKPLAVTSKAKTGLYYLAVFLIGFGLMNLFYGFLDGELFVSGRYGGYVGWMRYDEHKRGFAWFGFLSSLMICFGLAIIRINLFYRDKK